MRHLVRSIVVLSLLSPTLTPAARAEIRIAFYLGASQTKPSDLHVRQADRNNDATFHRVRWLAYAFRFSPYYGLRMIYTPPGHPMTRFALDFTHYKIYGQTEDVVTETGTWHGTAFEDAAPMRRRVQSFEITHGLNMLGLMAMQQLSSSPDGLYIGVGPVTYVPHSENRVDGIAGGDRYEFGGGFGVQTALGAQSCVANRRVFAEGKYDTGGVRVSIADGHAETAVHTAHELVGVRFGPCDDR
jgi:hypothetical protein